MDQIRASSAWVASRATHVLVDPSGIEKVVDSIDSIPKVNWDFEGIHYFDNGPLTVQYLFVLDALNFCFWPDEDLSYDHLALGLKAALQNDKSAFDTDRLQKYTGPQLRDLLKWPRPLPLEGERVRLLHEVGFELERSFGGKASNLVESCEKSAVKLVALVTSHFPGFRDHSIYKGHQIFLYKRAQIFAADLWGAFNGCGYGEFNDIGSVTIMADYIVPAVLRQLGVLKYSSTLATTVELNSEIGAGSEEEVELRACSIFAVEKMRELMATKSGKQGNTKAIGKLYDREVEVQHWYQSLSIMAKPFTRGDKADEIDKEFGDLKLVVDNHAEQLNIIKDAIKNLSDLLARAAHLPSPEIALDIHSSSTDTEGKLPAHVPPNPVRATRLAVLHSWTRWYLILWTRNDGHCLTPFCCPD